MFVFSLQKHFFPRLMLIKEQAPFSSDTPGFGSPRVPTPSFHWDLFPASECLSSDLSTACVHSWVLAELSRGELRLSRPFTDPSWVSSFAFTCEKHCHGTTKDVLASCRTQQDRQPRCAL